ncbi:MAG: hypothetical protein KIT52_06110 [Anaerolineae bacterium]|nr:hypothetical protein [Anaerolineae bacterium]
MGIRLIAAHSPQAKGRVERLFQTLQNRLVKALRRAGASDTAQANAVLPTFLPPFNQHFSQPAAQPGSAYRPVLSLAEANARIHFTYWRTVANDHTINLFGHVLSLPPLPARLNLAGRRLALHHRMDGRLAVVYGDQFLGLLQPVQLGPPRLEQFTPAPRTWPSPLCPSNCRRHPFLQPTPLARLPLPMTTLGVARAGPPSTAAGFNLPPNRNIQSSYGVISPFPLAVSSSLNTNRAGLPGHGIGS